MTEFIPVEDLVKVLLPYTIIHCMRERTKFPKELLIQLVNLKFITTTGMKNRAIDLEACKELGILVSGTDMGKDSGKISSSVGTVETTWAIILNLARNIQASHESMKNGNWQVGVAPGVYGKTLGLIGLGRLGKSISTIGHLFGMRIVAWSPNLTAERCKESEVELAGSLNQLLTQSDFISIHLVLSPTTTNLITKSELLLMKPTAYLINTSRGPIVNEVDLIEVLNEKRIQGAGLDVFDIEPLPRNHELRKLDNVLLSPHMGYVDDLAYSVWFEQTLENIEAFLENSPIRLLVIDPPAGTH